MVASEVKSLAGQTARATEEIAAQIGAIQSAAADAAQAIEQVNGIISEMSDIAAHVSSTVEEQNIAVGLISEGVNRASSEARTGTEAMRSLAPPQTPAPLRPTCRPWPTLWLRKLKTWNPRSGAFSTTCRPRSFPPLPAEYPLPSGA